MFYFVLFFILFYENPSVIMWYNLKLIGQRVLYTKESSECHQMTALSEYEYKRVCQEGKEISCPLSQSAIEP